MVSPTITTAYHLFHYKFPNHFDTYQSITPLAEILLHTLCSAGTNLEGDLMKLFVIFNYQTFISKISIFSIFRSLEELLDPSLIFNPNAHASSVTSIVRKLCSRDSKREGKMTRKKLKRDSQLKYSAVFTH